MAGFGIRRPKEFEDVFQRLKEFGIADKFTEIVVFATYVGFWANRTADGPFHLPIEEKSFTPEEKHRLYVLAIAHTMKEDGEANALTQSQIISPERSQDFSRLIERYVHGGLLEMRDRQVFSNPTRHSYGQGLASFVLKTLSAEEESKEVRLHDLLQDLDAFDSQQ